MQASLGNNYSLTNWYVFGDSLSRGIVYNSEKMRYELSETNFINLISKKFNAQVNNYSSFGATIKKGLQIFQRRKKDIDQPGIAFLEFGGNDCDFMWPEVAESPTSNHQPNVNLDLFYELYQELILRLQDKNIKPIILSLPPLVADRYFQNFSKDLDKENLLLFLGGSTKRIYQWHESYNSVLTDLAIGTNAEYIDIRRVFLEKLNPEKYMCADGIHPNRKGHQLIAKFLAEKLDHNNQ